MALITYSPIISHITGSAGHATFSSRGGRPVATAKARPRDPRTADQLIQRDILLASIEGWRQLDTVAKVRWYQLGYDSDITYHNLYTRYNTSKQPPYGTGTKSRLRYLSPVYPVLIQPTEGANQLTNLTAQAYAPIPGAILISWTGAGWPFQAQVWCESYGWPDAVRHTTAKYGHQATLAWFGQLLMFTTRPGKPHLIVCQVRNTIIKEHSEPQGLLSLASP